MKVEPSAAVRGMTNYLYQYYVSLIDSGFSPEQAIEFVFQFTSINIYYGLENGEL